MAPRNSTAYLRSQENDTSAETYGDRIPLRNYLSLAHPSIPRNGLYFSPMLPLRLTIFCNLGLRFHPLTESRHA